MHLGDREEQLPNVVLVQSQPALAQIAGSLSTSRHHRPGRTEDRQIERRTSRLEQFQVLIEGREPGRKSSFTPQRQGVGDEIREDHTAKEKEE